VRWPAILDDTAAQNAGRLDAAALAALAALRDELVIPVMPFSTRAFFTSSSLKWRMMASIFIM
jgi:hypothetical protein